MAGGGSIQGMRTSLSNNKRLLRKKSLFRPERTFLSLKSEYIKSAGGEIVLKKATKAQLRTIRLKIIKERERKFYTICITLLVLLSIIGLVTYNVSQNNNVTKADVEKIQLKDKAERSLVYILKGDNWLKERSWHNAIFEYEIANKILPNDYVINHRLANAYSLRCENEFKDCLKGKKLVDRLIKQFPQKTELLELRERLEYEY
ncbi:hypothetical protein [Polaribacter atrinae]|uniref:Uncharacterized protein n=1 Tax=Polaribacter atrinae TaxID=1333662 RepID=A0A176T6D3_9FLAO|nr:hypothetical protein [Polaribacter atrinae]OAD43420.1 hypothetical protein LPB303_13215 [Polaribacter atrinae]